eukprot:TRINITY_DN25508_c0_g1_i1.p1 TRINITY_DN25508_c0_g1~~TRINITY_DN25508_c0_g1_i1.p1  ORF type:complete len:349 (+),score=31.91 TRINITY_DN25508_c0_g1_i1:90-1136(+)
MGSKCCCQNRKHNEYLSNHVVVGGMEEANNDATDPDRPCSESTTHPLLSGYDTPIAGTPVGGDSEIGFESCMSLDTVPRSTITENQKKIPDTIGSFTNMSCKATITHEWDFHTPENLTTLASGGSIYAFLCCPGSELAPDKLKYISNFINLSSFTDPIQSVPIDILNPTEAGKYVVILNKAQYAMPTPIRAEDFTPSLVSNVAYQKACQPANPYVWTDTKEADTFRFTKTVIAVIYKVTIQLKVSVIPMENYPRLAATLNDGVAVHHALLLERTKRHVAYNDSTKTVKSVLLYHNSPAGGLLVTNITCICNTVLPGIISRVIDTFGSSGAQEVAETAERTRAYMMARA